MIKMSFNKPENIRRIAVIAALLAGVAMIAGAIGLFKYADADKEKYSHTVS